MRTYEVTIWPENELKPYTARYEAPTSIDALLRALGAVRESGCKTAHVRPVTIVEEFSDQTSNYRVAP